MSSVQEALKAREERKKKEQEESIARIQAKKDKNYALADQIRNDLAAKGVTLIDTPQGTKYQIN